MSAIDVRSLRKSFASKSRQIDAVRDVSFVVEPGERLACIGPNGAGKSTTIKMLTGILHPSSGDAVVLGYTPWRERQRLVKHLGVLFGQRSQLVPDMSARMGLRLLGAIYGLDKPFLSRRMDELQELLGAHGLFDQPVRTLSLGQRMRCELAAALLHAPSLLFLDEPTIGMDLLAKQRFRELLVSLNEDSGTTVFLTSHDVPDIEAVAQRVLIINHGTLIRDDRVDVLKRSLLSSKLIDVRFDSPPADIRIDEQLVVRRTATSVELRVDTRRSSVRQVLNDILSTGIVADISVSDPPLEEIIAEIYEAPA